MRRDITREEIESIYKVEVVVELVEFEEAGERAIEGLEAEIRGERLKYLSCVMVRGP